MKVIGVVGSPKKDGLTNQLVSETLGGAGAGGAETELLHLADFDIKPCLDCRGKTCWEDRVCRYEDDSKRLIEELENCDGLILGAPVYYLDVNGITKNFMDKMRLANVNGKPAMGITIAGGTGKGLVLALQSLYHFFFCVGFRGYEPLPVARFNFTDALKKAYSGGRNIAQLGRRAFDDLADRLVWYNNVEYMGFDIIDENFYLADLVVNNVKVIPGNQEQFEKAKEALERARLLIGEENRKGEAAEWIIKAYEEGVSAWGVSHF